MYYIGFKVLLDNNHIKTLKYDRVKQIEKGEKCRAFRLLIILRRRM